MPPKRESRLNDEEEDQTMNAFWSESWKKVDPKRISEYGNAIDDSPDEMIALLQQHHAKTVCDAGGMRDLLYQAYKSWLFGIRL